jgi:hypothetical protein
MQYSIGYIAEQARAHTVLLSKCPPARPQLTPSILDRFTTVSPTLTPHSPRPLLPHSTILFVERARSLSKPAPYSWISPTHPVNFGEQLVHNRIPDARVGSLHPALLADRVDLVENNNVQVRVVPTCLIRRGGGGGGRVSVRVGAKGARPLSPRASENASSMKSSQYKKRKWGWS